MSTFSRMYKQYTFSDPSPPLKCTHQHFGIPKQGSYTAQFNDCLIHVSKIALAMFYILHITVNVVYILQNLIERYFLCAQGKYVQFHNIKFKMPESQLLIGLETSFKK